VPPVLKIRDTRPSGGPRSFRDMPSLPPSLLARLSVPERAAADRLTDILGQTLATVYSEALLDHQESRGDDAQLFGFKVYKHERYALMQAVADDSTIRFVEHNGAYHLGIGPLRIRVDSLGHFAHEDVRDAFPDASPTKQAVGRSNAMQLRFEMPELEPVPDEAAFSLNALTAGHFGNPREGLVKWYIGAWTELETGGRSWAWIERQDEPGKEVAPLAPNSPIVPFNERSADTVSVRPRRSA
jgi:hypothetical protein